MKIAVACDHRGFKLKNVISDFLKTKGYTVLDFGTFSQDPCDYPDYVYPAALAVKERKADRAIVICYTGIGSCIVANKVQGVRAALLQDITSAKLTRQHNNSNVLVLASRAVKNELAKRIVTAWLVTEFEGGRHMRRVKKIEKIEEKENV